jgi:predicted ester cyclase
MSAQANKQIVRDFYAALQREDYAAAAQLCHEKFQFYLQLDTPIPGVQGFIESEKKNFDAFKGFQFWIEHLLAEDDRVAAYMIFDGIQSGVCEGVPPTGNRLHFSLMMLLRVADGKIIEKRAHFDRADIRRQLTGAATAAH